MNSLGRQQMVPLSGMGSLCADKTAPPTALMACLADEPESEDVLRVEAVEFETSLN